MTAAAIIENRLMDNPMATDGLVADRPQTAKAWVEINMLALIGGLAYIRKYHPEKNRGGRRPHHDKAAAEFKARYEAIYGMGNPAIDPSVEPVDTSLRAHDAGMAFRIDRGRKLAAAMDHLGNDARDRLIAVVVLGIPAGDDAALLPSGKKNWRHQGAAVRQIIADLDKLAVHWGY